MLANYHPFIGIPVLFELFHLIKFSSALTLTRDSLTQTGIQHTESPVLFSFKLAFYGQLLGEHLARLDPLPGKIHRQQITVLVDRLHSPV